MIHLTRSQCHCQHYCLFWITYGCMTCTTTNSKKLVSLMHFHPTTGKSLWWSTPCLMLFFICLMRHRFGNLFWMEPCMPTLLFADFLCDSMATPHPLSQRELFSWFLFFWRCKSLTLIKRKISDPKKKRDKSLWCQSCTKGSVFGYLLAAP